MNKINHKSAQDAIADIVARIKKQIEAALSYKEQKVKYETDSRLAQEFRNAKIAEINSAYLVELQKTREFIVEKLEKVAELEKENENILDFDVPEFSETMAAINATKGKLPEAVIFGIRDKFKGNYQVMVTIRAALESFGIDLKPYKFDDYADTAQNRIAALIINAKNIETSEDTSFISLEELLNDVVYFGRCSGMDFSNDFISLKSDVAESFEKVKDAVKTQIAREAMGLQ